MKAAAMQYRQMSCNQLAFLLAICISNLATSTAAFPPPSAVVGLRCD